MEGWGAWKCRKYTKLYIWAKYDLFDVFWWQIATKSHLFKPVFNPVLPVWLLWTRKVLISAGLLTISLLGVYRMRLSLKYEQKLKKKAALNALDVGVMATEICRLKTILYHIGVSVADENLAKLRLWKD